jgi:hypothetical protein
LGSRSFTGGTATTGAASVGDTVVVVEGATLGETVGATVGDVVIVGAVFGATGTDGATGAAMVAAVATEADSTVTAKAMQRIEVFIETS